MAKHIGSLESLHLQEEDACTGRPRVEITLDSLTKFIALKTLKADYELVLERPPDNEDLILEI
jgi:hypothetical protein